MMLLTMQFFFSFKKAQVYRKKSFTWLIFLYKVLDIMFLNLMGASDVEPDHKKSTKYHAICEKQVYG